MMLVKLIPRKTRKRTKVLFLQPKRIKRNPRKKKLDMLIWEMKALEKKMWMESKFLLKRSLYFKSAFCVVIHNRVYNELVVVETKL